MATLVTHGWGAVCSLVVRGLGARPRTRPLSSSYAGRDWGILQDVQARLLGTGEFDGVHLPSLPEEVGFPAGETRAAVLEPADWTEVNREWDDGSDVTRQFRFRLTLMGRDADPERNAQALDRLANIASNAVNGQSLAGVTFPDTTRLRRGAWKARTTPEQQLVLAGDCTYEILGFAAHDTTDL